MTSILGAEAATGAVRRSLNLCWLARPEPLGLLRSAQRLLAATVEAVVLRPTYGERA